MLEVERLETPLLQRPGLLERPSVIIAPIERRRPWNLHDIGHRYTLFVLGTCLQRALQLNRTPAYRVILELQRLHQRRVIKVAPVENHRLLQLRLDPMEVRMTKLVPLREYQQRVGALERVVIRPMVTYAIAEYLARILER